MTKAEKLNKIIEIAEEGGWVPKVQWKWSPEIYQSAIFFSHDFLKAYFGEEDVGTTSGEIVTEGVEDLAEELGLGNISVEGRWQYHARNLVLSEDRIEYLWENR